MSHGNIKDATSKEHEWQTNEPHLTGKNMAYIRGEMTGLDDHSKTVFATAEHHKFNVPMPEHHRAIQKALRADMKNRSKL